MLQSLNFSQSLRAIGQALEILKIDTFEMENEGDDYLVRGDALSRGSIERGVAEGMVEYVWGIVPGRAPLHTTNETSRATPRTPVDLCYTSEDLNRLEQEGQAKRSATSGIASVDDLPQLLRTTGAYLDQKGARLLKLTREGESLVVQYEAASGQRHQETISSSNLYDFWVEMCMKRVKIPQHA